MCSIIGSYNRKEIIELSEQNAERGTYSHSITYYDPKNLTLYNPVRKFGKLEHKDVVQDGRYIIVHQQAPTTENKDYDSIHPAELNHSFLWHNGIIKPSAIVKLQEELSSGYSWDTMLLLQRYSRTRDINNIGDMSGIDGSFACLLFDSGLKIFRNAIAPMFVAPNGTVSSTYFDGATSLQPNKIFSFYPGLFLTEYGKFDTVLNPYYIEEDE